MQKQQKTNKEKFLALVKEQDKSSVKAIEWRNENKAWLRKSQAIAFSILRLLKSKKMTQKQLAEALNVSPQVVNKWLKGKENFTLETISKLETALETPLMQVGIKNPEVVKIETTVSYQQTIRAVHSVGNYTGRTHNEPKVIAIKGNSVWDKNKEYAYN